MNYHLNDKVLYKGKECIIIFINNGMAWIALWEEPHISIAKLNKNGKDDAGVKARGISRKECLEV